MQSWAGLMQNVTTASTFCFVFPPLETDRCQDWMKSYSGNLASNKQWEMMQSKIGLKYGTSSDMQHYEELPNLNYTVANDSWCPILNPDLSSIEETSVADYGEPPRRFIDAWSSENITPSATNSPYESSVSGRDKLPLSTLTLSMSNAIEDGTDICMKSQPLNRMGPDSPLGGPLAEVLQSSNMASPQQSGGASSNKSSSHDLFNLMSKSCCGSHEASPRDSPSRLVSSPSRVLHKALVSLSDSSTSSSPTFAATSRSDFTFPWMNLNK